MVTVTLTFDLISGIILYRAFEVGIQNLVCGCILGWQYVVYHFWVTVTLLTLTSDLISRIIVSGAYLLYYLRYM